ncbi:hypothetical protein R1sor_016903 [Riccia sorocarpa]|uniref:Potassium transporter n=1 Tax=Riccia sorocarpa TaxID=122646 RepID=A0ABD3HK85_9MARC
MNQSTDITESGCEERGQEQNSSQESASWSDTFTQRLIASAFGFSFFGNEVSSTPEERTSVETSAEIKTDNVNIDLESRPSGPSKSARSFNQPVVEAAPQNRSGFGKTIILAYKTLGIVYGDLATSPLYVYPTVNIDNASKADYLGILSVVFWTLTLIGILKYSFIVLQADDHGEGGTFAVYSLLCRHAKIGQNSYDNSHQMSGRRVSHFTEPGRRPKRNRVKSFLESSKAAQRLLLFLVMTGTCMLVGDGILTPAISVLSATEGIRTAAPSLSKAVVLVITAIILILLFMGQKYGTQRVSLVFSPVMALWLVTTSAIGVYNIVVHYPGVFKAFSPAYVYYFFRDNKKDAWFMLGGIVLCITGAEAMYADMGHFDKRSIQVAFTMMVYPSVLLTYAGQTAYLIKNPSDHGEAFFKMIPKRVYWPMFVIATLAAVVASQGLISATFSVIKQSMALHYFPRVKLVHTSENKEGQIYSPEVNYLLMILCLAVVFGFRSSHDIGNAFGVAVVFVMLFTTFLICLVMLVIWQTSVFLVIPYFLVYLVIEGTYMSAVLTKVPQGGWFPFVISAIVTLVMFSWNMGCQTKFKYEMKNTITKDNLGDLLAHVGSVRVPGICFFYTELCDGIPPIVGHYVKNVRSLHRVLVFITIQWLPVKTVLPAERFLVGRVGFPGVYRCIARYGYRDLLEMQTDEFVDQFTQTLSEYIMLSSSSTRHNSSFGRSGRNESLSRLAVATEVAMINEVEELNQARSVVSSMDIPYAKYLELGMLCDI